MTAPSTQDHYEAGHKYVVEGIKLLLAINGGGAVALLAFVGDNPSLRSQSTGDALLGFGLGALFAAINFFSAYAAQLQYGKRELPNLSPADRERSNQWAHVWHYVSYALFIASIVCFVGGLVLARSALIASTARAEPVASGAVQVIDGDTISARGQTVRLVGFDTPEAGMNAMCEAERTLAARATAKLRQLVAGGALDLAMVPCSCPAGTEGTPFCNRGRACGVLKAAGKDVAAAMIADGLAKPLLCSRDRCPRREPWC